MVFRPSLPNVQPAPSNDLPRDLRAGQTGPRHKTPPKLQARSRVGTGRALFLDRTVDGRSIQARRFKELYAQVILDLGGDPTAAQDIIARRAVSLAVICEEEEAKLVAGGGANIDVQRFTTAANSLRRLLCDLGLERRARDITGTLDSYLATKRTPTPTGSDLEADEAEATDQEPTALEEGQVPRQ